MMVVEQLQHQQQQQQQSVCVRSEDLVDKKKRRSTRRSKQNSFVQGKISFSPAPFFRCYLDFLDFVNEQDYFT